MNRTIILFLAISVVMMLAITAHAENMTATATSSCADYNHVGNEWSQIYSVNGIALSRDTTLDLHPGDEVEVSVIITESDKSPDVGTGVSKYTVTSSDLANGFLLNINVVVQEDKGRYAGCQAVWNVTFMFAPYEK